MLADVLEAVVAEAPERSVLISSGRIHTMAEVLEGAARLGETLEPCPGRLGVVTDNYAVALAAFSLLARGDRTIGLLSPRLGPAVLAEQLESFDPDVVVFDSGGNLTGLELGPGVEPSPGPLGLTVAVRRSAALRDERAHFVLFTSGTTGRPKMVAHTEASLLAAYRLIRGVRFEILDPAKLETLESHGQALELGWYGLAAIPGYAVRHLCSLPVATIGGFNIGLQALLGGEEIVAQPVYEPRAVLEVIERLGVTSVAAAPVTGQAVLRVLKRTGQPPDSSILVFGIGGSAVPPGLHAEVEAAFGCRAITGYGATELGGVVATTRFDDSEINRWETVGRPVPGVSLRTDRKGLLQVKTPALGAGYLNQAGKIVPFELDEGWYSTGDYAELDAEGVCRIFGRQAGVIIRGARKIDPALIETALEAHAGVARACVVGVPSRVAGEEDVVAVVTLASVEVSGAQLRAWCRRRLEDNALVPRRVVAVQGIPLTWSGEPDRGAVRRMFQARSAA